MNTDAYSSPLPAASTIKAGYWRMLFLKILTWVLLGLAVPSIEWDVGLTVTSAVSSLSFCPVLCMKSHLFVLWYCSHWIGVYSNDFISCEFYLQRPCFQKRLYSQVPELGLHIIIWVNTAQSIKSPKSVRCGKKFWNLKWKQIWIVTWPTSPLIWKCPHGSHKPQAKKPDLNSCFNQKKKKRILTAAMSCKSDKEHAFYE